MIIAFYKPYGVLSQFTPDSSNGSTNRTLAEFGFPANVYAVGRLDADSEGFIVLSDEAAIVQRLLEPRFGHPRRYWAQVEGNVTEEAIEQLQQGVRIQNYQALPCTARLLDTSRTNLLPERVPPIRVRRQIAVSWLQLELREGKNRQVRRMTAAVGFPTLRLIRVGIGALDLPIMDAGAWRVLTPPERARLLQR